jgi:hypothetical protein
MRKSLVLALLLVLGACGAASELPPPETSVAPYVNSEVMGTNLSRVVDREAGIVCYLNYRGGIWCTPISQTELDEGGEG